MRFSWSLLDQQSGKKRSQYIGLTPYLWNNLTVKFILWKISTYKKNITGSNIWIFFSKDGQYSISLNSQDFICTCSKTSAKLFWIHKHHSRLLQTGCSIKQTIAVEENPTSHGLWWLAWCDCWSAMLNKPLSSDCMLRSTDYNCAIIFLFLSVSRCCHRIIKVLSPHLPLFFTIYNSYIRLRFVS